MYFYFSRIVMINPLLLFLFEIKIKTSIFANFGICFGSKSKFGNCFAKPLSLVFLSLHISLFLVPWKPAKILRICGSPTIFPPCHFFYRWPNFRSQKNSCCCCLPPPVDVSLVRTFPSPHVPSTPRSGGSHALPYSLLSLQP
jgi:hypothetical protein